MRKLIYEMKKNTATVILNDCRIDIHVRGRQFYAKYPVRVEDCEKYLIDLMMWVTFFDFGENRKGDFNGVTLDLPCDVAEVKTDNDKIMIEYSGGVDSSAVYELLPKEKTIPVNCYRDYDHVYGSNQNRVIKAVGGIYIYTDFELIREMYINDRGYNIGIGYIAPCFPLINILKIKHITLGGVFEDQGFWYGTPFTFNSGCSITQSEVIGQILSTFDIHISLPPAGLSEVLTSKIVNNSPLKDLACSCHTETLDNNLCRHCYKCFRKLGFIGEQLDFNNVKTRDYIYYMLSLRPLKMAASCVYGIQHGRYTIAEFQKYMDVDVSFCDRYNDEFLKRWNHPEIYDLVISKLKEMEIEPMNLDDIENIHKFVNFINKDGLY